MCDICNVARQWKSQDLNKSKKGRPAKTEDLDNKEAKKNTRSYCFSEVAKGKPHDCTKSTRVANLSSMLSPRTKDNVTAENLRGKVAINLTQVVTVATLGTPMTVTVGASAKRNLTSDLPLSHKALFNLKTSVGLSNNQTLQVGKILRQESGRGIIEPGFNNALIEIANELMDFFHCTPY